MAINNSLPQARPEKKPSEMADLGLPKPLEEFHHEAAVVPEQRVEVQIEKIAGQEMQKASEDERAVQEQIVESVVPAASVVPQTKDELTKQIEDILSENIAEDYKKMPPALQNKFRREGEMTAAKIKIMLDSGKVRFKKIVDLLLAWLKIIPGVNKYFLHQEAKIKADKIIHLKEKSIFDQ